MDPYQFVQYHNVHPLAIIWSPLIPDYFAASMSYVYISLDYITQMAALLPNCNDIQIVTTALHTGHVR